jgi:dihydroflavonol-4-reductase
VLIPPAVNGTTYVMKACQAAGVRRCVITSSLASVQNLAAADKPADRTYNESHWGNPDRPEGLGAYPKSKILAEKVAWDFQAALAEDQKFELVTICPGFIMGPPIRKESFTSGGWLKRLMEGVNQSISAEHCCAVDVRDTATAHLLAIKNPAAANRRFILCHSSPSFQEYAGAVAAKYRPLGWPITENLAESNPDEYISLFDNSASKELGVVYTDWNKTMVDMADAMVALGSVVKPEATQ